MTIFDDITAALRGKFQPAGQSLKAAADNLRMGLWGKPQRPDYSMETLFAAARTNEVVFACLEVAGQALVDPRIYVERRNTDGTWAEQDLHPAAMLLKRPNPFYNETTFLRAAYTSMHVAGIFYVEIVRKTPNSPPVALYPLDPSRIKVILLQNGNVDYYEWQDGNVKVRVDVDNMMVWRKPDLQARWFGISPLGVAMGAIAGDSAQTNFIQAFFDGGGQPSGILTVKDRTLTAEEAEAIRQGWRAKFDGRRGGDRRDIAVLDNNAVYAKVGAGLDEIASEQLRGIAETRICMVFSTPPLIIYSYIGLQGATYSNLKEAWAQFWDSKLTPWLKEYRTWLTDQLLIQFEDDALIFGERVRFNWDMSQVAALSDDMDAISNRTREEWKLDLITRAEARTRLKLETNETGGDVFYSQVVVGKTASVEIAEPPQKTPPKMLPAPAGRKALVTDAQLKAIDDGRESLASRIQVKVESYLEQEYNGFADSASAEGGDDGDHIAGIMRPGYRGAIKLAYEDAEALLSEHNVDIAFDLKNPRVVETIAGLMTRVKSITGTTKEDVRAIIANGVDAGLSTEQIGAKIREAAPELSKSRAWTIARTETADAYSRGALLAYKESGVVTHVEWNATLDNKTSQVCTGLHDKRVPLGEAFPGGFGGPPAHPNCRSVLLPIVE